MRTSAVLVLLGLVLALPAADVESRVLTHYVPQDLLEKAVRTEGWTEVPLNIKGGTLKGDTIRIWTGGSIDRGNGDQPGQNVNGPSGLTETERTKAGVEIKKLVLSQQAADAFALLVKTDVATHRRCPEPGKPLEIKLTKDKERLWIGFNDEKGRYMDNHLGKGRRHESDPLWMRIEVVRTIVD
jgi:hypothetical protein